MHSKRSTRRSAYHRERLTASANPNPHPNIDAHTARCKWLGEPMDYSMAIEGMQLREEAAKARTVAPS